MNLFKTFSLLLVLLYTFPIYSNRPSSTFSLQSLLSHLHDNLRPECEEAIPTLFNFCVENFNQHERNLSICLQKRDQCLDNRFKSDDPQSCQELNHCMKAPSRGILGLISSAQDQPPGCNYFWDPASSQCTSQRPLLGNHHHCPGRRRLSTIMTFGMGQSYDSNFDCSSHALMLQEHANQCSHIKTQVLFYCREEMRSRGIQELPDFQSHSLNQFEQQSFQADPLERREHISDIERSPVPPRRPEGIETRNIQRGESTER